MIPLTWNEALSGIFGSISLASWIFLLVPQLIENYTQRSAEAISIPFLLIWAAGDVLNLAGALWAGLVPTVIALAIYFCFADGILIVQCFYYNALNARKARKEAETEVATKNGVPSDQTPLLSSPTHQPSHKRTPSHGSNLGLPGSHRRSSATSQPAHRDSLSAALAEPSPRAAWLKNTLSILAIFAIGTLGWFLAYKAHAWQPSPSPKPHHHADAEGESTPLGASLLGYASAILYLGARIPQIVKNQRSRSCEGLSLLFFLLSVLGNATYGAGILWHSVQREYVLTNLPWLIGSLGTMVEDAVIFAQFRRFGTGEEKGDGEAVE